MAAQVIRNCGESEKNWIYGRILDSILFPSFFRAWIFGVVGEGGTFNRGVWFRNPQRLPHRFGF